MNTSEMLSLLRFNCLIEDTNVDYTDAVLLRELNDAQRTKFERIVLDAKADYWLQKQDYAVVQGQSQYRLPARAVGVSKVELGGPQSTSQGFIRLPRISEDNINIFQSPAASLGQPRRFLIRGDRVTLDPYPDNTGYVLRVWYYVRPPQLMPTQGNTDGLITAVNTVTPSVTVAVIPSRYNPATYASPAALTAANRADIVGAGGWRELQVADAQITNIAGLVVTFAAGTDLSSVQAGDFLRASDQHEWPSIPDDFHRTIVDVATVKVLIQRDYQNKAAGFNNDANADFQRFTMLVSNRVTEEPIVHRADLPSLRGARYWGVWTR